MRTTFKIRIWLSLAVAAVSLVAVSSASAMLSPSDGGDATLAPRTPVVTNPGGFAWGDAAIGAAIALVVTLAAFALVYVTRNRSRLAASH